MGKRLIDLKNRVRLRYVLLFTLLLFLVLEIPVRRLERRPDLVLRNEGRSHMALPYMYRQMELTKFRRVIAFLGASETQGVVNTTAETTYPVDIEKLLAARGVATHCFNLATIGNGLGDNLALAVEAMRRGADLLVFCLHYKLFSNSGALAFASTYRDSLYYLRHRPDFSQLQHRYFLISNRDYMEIRFSKFLESFWAFYRENQLISYLIAGDLEPEPLTAQARKWLFKGAGPAPRKIATQIEMLGTPEKRNRDNLWQLQPAEYHQDNGKAYEKISLDPQDVHFKIFELINELSRASKVKILIFLTPLNRGAVNQFKYFDWNKHAKFVEMTSQTVLANDNYFLDLTDAVENRCFTDGDHLNMNGHRQLAEALVPTIARILAESTP